MLEQQPEGPFEFCDMSLGVYWRRGWWARDKLRGAALSDNDLRDQGVEAIDILRAPFHRGWLVEKIEHDGEWCDPQWPVYYFETIEPSEGASEKASWIELG